MRNHRLRRLAAAVAATGLAATALVALSAAPASAATSTVTVPYRCVTTMFNVGYDLLESLQVTLTAPTTVAQGDPIPITYDLVNAPHNVPVALGNAVYSASPSVSGQNGTGGPLVSSTGTGSNSAPANVPANAVLPITVSQSISMPTAVLAVGNNIKLRPAVLTINVVSGDDGIGGGLVICTPEPSAPIALNVYIDGTLAVSPIDKCTAQAGNTTGGVGCSTQQNLFSTVLPGSLSQAAVATAPNPNSTTIDLGSTTSSISGATLTAPLNAVTVTDDRGGSFQWSLTATLTNFSDGTHTINASNAAITPACAVAAAGSAPGAVAGGAAQSFGGPPVALCTGPSVPDVSSGSTGGQWTVTGPVSLAVPPFQGAGVYVATMTINLA